MTEEELRTAPPPGDGRYDNSPEGNDHCPFCCNDGWVIAGTFEWQGARFDGAAPCPACVLGHRAEFPAVGKWPWGRDGYWRGRPWGLSRGGCPHLPGNRLIDPEAEERAVAEARAAFRRVLEKPALPPVSDREISGLMKDPAPSTSVPDPPSGASGEGNEPEEGAGTHTCTDGKEKPWSREECATCTPVPEEEMIDL